jgi:hypothetical protein
VTDLESAVDQLQAVPLEDFVGERKRLAKELRGAGEREAAAELAKLPKPSAPAWSLNHIAREQPGPVGAWLDATDALREASSSADRSSGAALRAAMTAHREATRRLIATVRDTAHPNGRALTEPMLDRVRDLLQAATADPARAEQLRAGRVVERDDETSEEPAVLGSAAKSGGATTKRDARSGAAATKRGAKSGAAARRPAAGRDAKRTLQERAAAERAEREAEQRVELERLAGEAEARLAELRETESATAAAATQADERLEQAQQTLRRSESEADAARQAAAEAADAAAQAERELQKLAAKLAS